MEVRDATWDQVDAKGDDSRHFDSCRWFSVTFAEMQVANREFGSLDKDGLRSATGQNLVTH